MLRTTCAHVRLATCTTVPRVRLASCYYLPGNESWVKHSFRLFIFLKIKIPIYKDIDECNDEPCAGNGDCVNSGGGYACLCMDGFTESQGTCVDVDECLNNPCIANERCSNIDGG